MLKIIVTDKKQIEKTEPDPNTLVISFRDPYDIVRIKQGFESVVVIECHDADPNKHIDERYNVLFNPEHARKILSSVSKYCESRKNLVCYDGTIIVHCYMGRSRSAAIGKFLGKLYKCDVEYCGENGVNPNTYIYDTMVDMWFELSSIEKEGSATRD
jgi:predicted protein tyrosine phosphatase